MVKWLIVAEIKIDSFQVKGMRQQNLCICSRVFDMMGFKIGSGPLDKTKNGPLALPVALVLHVVTPCSDDALQVHRGYDRYRLA